MSKSKAKVDSASEAKNKTSLYIKPSSHDKVKTIGIKEKESPNTLFERAIDEFIERWEKKNGEIKL